MEPRPRSRWTNRAPKLCRQPPSRRRPRRPFCVRTSAAVGTAITSGAACAGSSTARRPFRAEAGRRRGHREDPHRNESRDLPCAHVEVFRHRGAPPPVTRTRSQSQAKQQPAGGGPALLPFVVAVAQTGPQTGASISRGTTVPRQRRWMALMGRGHPIGPNSGVSVPPLRVQPLWSYLCNSLRPEREPQFTSGSACNRGEGGASKALTRHVLQSQKQLATRQRRPASGVPARRARAGARAAPSALSRAAGGPCAVGRDRREHRGVVSRARPVPGAAAAAVASVDVQPGGAAGVARRIGARPSSTTPRPRRGVPRRARAHPHHPCRERHGWLRRRASAPWKASPCRSPSP
jgi:hypothetical protein